MRSRSWFPGAARVLDLGCGDGTLLEHLVRHYAVVGRGIELSEQGVLACVRRGLSVRQGNLEEGLADYPDGSFDFVILSQTLPYLDDPGFILQEMLRVGGCAIVSFSNWGYWRCRLMLLLGGRIPEAPGLPEPWYCKPRWQALHRGRLLTILRVARHSHPPSGLSAPRTPPARPPPQQPPRLASALRARAGRDLRQPQAAAAAPTRSRAVRPAPAARTITLRRSAAPIPKLSITSDANRGARNRARFTAV